ncbi:MAG: hypothetical protein ACYCW6_31275, partial [Candidatus Xenobia bacterium]
PRGHAIECRIYAEAPERGFMPGVGVLQEYRPPVGPGIRVDSGVTAGGEVTVHYDPMLAKLAVWAGDREQAIARMRWALQHFVVMGVANNVEFLDRVLAHPAFAAGDLHTHFLDLHPECLHEPSEPPGEVGMLAAWLASRKLEEPSSTAAAPQGPWALGGAWRQV